MNTIVKTLTFVFALAFATATFAGTLADYPNVRDAVNNDNLTLYNYWACLDDGYELTQTNVQPIYYQIPPQGEHQAHTVTITMTKDVGQTTKYVITEVQIIAKADGTLTCKDMAVKRQTVN